LAGRFGESAIGRDELLLIRFLFLRPVLLPTLFFG
jgi:hypothetical protein